MALDYLLLLACAAIIAVVHGENVQVGTNNGIVEGKKLTTVALNKPYYSFQGIPYGKPPLGNLRFSAPVAAENWSGVLDATNPRDSCIELYSEGGSEDCLYLNVFTPSVEKSNLPVIVWIHGGSFVFIYGKFTMNGTDHFMDENVVFVTVQYRLGAFGFLSTEDDVIPGNFGLKDQLLAVNWVHDNIARFGGDPGKVTLMGQSAGSCAVSYLAMSPQLEGKIHGVIAQSGPVLSQFAISRYPTLGAFTLSTLLGFETTDSALLLEELRKRSAEEIRQASLKTHNAVVFGIGPFHTLLFIPATEPQHYEGALITKQSYEQLRLGDFPKIPHMMGFTSAEAHFMVDEFNVSSAYYKKYDDMVRRYIPIDMNTRYEKVGAMIRDHYTNGTRFLSNLTNAVHFVSDDQFVRPIVKEAKLVGKQVPTYLYRFSYEGDLGNENRPLPGVGHGEELEYLFYNRDRGNVSRVDTTVRLRLLKLWTNFAKYGNPTPNNDKVLQNQRWRPVDSRQHLRYLDIGENLVMSVNPHKKDIDFWDYLYKKYGNPPYDTY